MPPMKCKVKCGKEFEVEVEVGPKNTSDLIKIIALVVVAIMMLIVGLAAYGAVEGDFTAFEKTLDTIVKLVELLTYGR